ncbi:MAG TPA: SusC/RagA family TonB-linked outer membrane protein [Longimicrobium sp.]|nr:SusC/RagA family TonB-linked outer membrane protein [Longimicrobium sp.]
MRKLRWLLATMVAVAMAPGALAAQEATVVTGRVTNASGAAENAVLVRIDDLRVGTNTVADGTYRLVIPAGRVRAGQTVTISASRVGLNPQRRTITLNPGATVTQNFQLGSDALRLNELVVTGAGTTQTAVEIGSVRNNVRAELISRSNENNVVQALAGKAPNVEVTASSGEPGASSYIRMRGTRTVAGDGQPLFVVDGVPINNQSFSTSNFNPIDELGAGEISGTTQSNRVVDINPEDIENVEILKGAAAGALYGARAGQGVVLITTKTGRAGGTRYSYKATLGFDDVAREYPLQTRFGQGRNGTAPAPNGCDNPGVNGAFCTRSWGPDLSAGNVPVFNHASEAYDTGRELEHNLSISGGTDRTTFYLSLARLDNSGVFKGPNNWFDRTTVRLKGTHFLAGNFSLGGNVAYADTRGSFIQRGNNVNGLQLGLLRTPPNFNNCLPQTCYLDPNTLLHRSFRMQNPQIGSESESRGFDNPFFALFEPVNEAQVGRVFGNVTATFLPRPWLTLAYTVGADYSTDERLEGAPQASSDVSAGGRVTDGKIVDYQISSDLSATARYRLNSSFNGTVTLGHSLNNRNNRILATVGRTLVAPEPFKLSNTVSRDPVIDTESIIHNSSVFGQATFEAWDQLYLTLAARNDGSSTFSENNRRSWFPKASVAWNAVNLAGNPEWLGLLKLRAAYGEAGQEPLPFLTTNAFSSAIVGGIVQGTGFTPTYGGLGGLVSDFVRGADDLRPERTKEFEAGFDIGLADGRAEINFTYYNARTEDVILNVALPPSSGYTLQATNAGTFRNRGVELAVTTRPISRANLAWDLGFQWGMNRSRVLELEGVDWVAFDPNSITPYGVAFEGQPVGVFYDYGMVRCGVSPTGMDAAVPGVDLAAVCAGAPKGALYIAEDGFPVADANQRVIGDPNPDWTGGFNTNLRVGRLELGGLVDIRKGGQIYNGTRGALYSYGTHKDTEVRATCDDDLGCSGNEKVFGQSILPGPVVGPGVNTSVPIGANWYRDGLAPCPFSGVSELCLEDGSYVKLRELSVGYNLTSRWLTRSTGLTNVNVRLAGRNLHTWTDYTGYDPETNLGGAIQKTRGMDYFNMPQTRSFVVSVTLNH